MHANDPDGSADVCHTGVVGRRDRSVPGVRDIVSADATFAPTHATGASASCRSQNGRCDATHGA
jgi:hypothetical protein